MGVCDWVYPVLRPTLDSREEWEERLSSGQGALYCRDQSRCAGFASLTAREYEDAMAFWEWGVREREQLN